MYDELPFSPWFEKLPFSIDIFWFLFYARVMLDGTLSVGAHAHKNLIDEGPQKLHGWHDQFLFVKVPNGFPLPSHWGNLWKGHSEVPELSGEEDFKRCLFSEINKL